MKSIGKILFYIFSLLAVVSAFYVVFTEGAFDPEMSWDPDKGPVTMIVWVAIIALLVSFVVFLVYKVVDIIKHPAHLGEALRVFGAVLIALVVGFIFSNGDEIIYGTGEVFESGTQSKLIGTGIIATITLLVLSVLYMIYDTVVGLFKS